MTMLRNKPTKTKQLARELGLLPAKRKQGAGSDEQCNGNGSKKRKAGQMLSYLIVIDFESTCWENKKGLQEIIEFPAVLLDLSTGKVSSEFHHYVVPVENPILSTFCKELTGISQDQVNNGIPLPTCLFLFNQWLKKVHDTVGVVLMEPGREYSARDGLCALATWSDWDMGVCLNYECSRKQIRKPAIFNQWIDIRYLYRNFYDRKPAGLNGALEDLGLVFSGRQHSGIDDAKNTAKLCYRMVCDGCCMAITKSIARKEAKSFIKPPSRQDEDAEAAKKSQKEWTTVHQEGLGTCSDPLKQSTSRHHLSATAGDKDSTHTTMPTFPKEPSPKTKSAASQSVDVTSGSPVIASSSKNVIKGALQNAVPADRVKQKDCAKVPNSKIQEPTSVKIKEGAAKSVPPGSVSGVPTRGTGQNCLNNLQGSYIEEDWDKACDQFFEDIAGEVENWSENSVGVHCDSEKGSSLGRSQNILKSNCSGGFQIHSNQLTITPATSKHLNQVAVVSPATGNYYGASKNRWNGGQSNGGGSPLVHGMSNQREPSMGSMVRAVEETPPVVAKRETFEQYSSDHFMKTCNILETPAASSPNCIEETPPLENKTPALASRSGYSCSTFSNNSRGSNSKTMAIVVPNGGKITPPLCGCGKRTKRRTVVTPGPNEGLPFYVCPNGRGSGIKKRSCGYFRWEFPTSVNKDVSSRQVLSEYGE